MRTSHECTLGDSVRSYGRSFINLAHSVVCLRHADITVAVKSMQNTQRKTERKIQIAIESEHGGQKYLCIDYYAK